MRFRILGPLRAWDGAGWAPIRAAQQRVVLAVLLIEAGRAVSAERLIDEIWGERPPPSALLTVQGYVWRLRKRLTSGALLTRGRGYELDLGSGELDAEVFDQLVDDGTRSLALGNQDTALRRLSEAIDLWQGPALADVAAGPTVATEVARLEQRRLTALEDRLDVLLELGRHAEVVDELHRAVADHPLRERLRGQLMLALYRSGRRAEALGAYREAHELLVTELGLPPGPKLRRLEQAILADEPDLAEKPRPIASVLRVTPAQLPAPVSAFTGRDEPLRRLDSLVPQHRPSVLVISTISGTAGIGKTALAVHWAHRVRHRFPDGQLYVNLRAYATSSPLRPIDALAGFLAALGVPASQVPIDTEAAATLYRSMLADKRILVLLDDAANPEQVRPLLPGSPGCLVLVTSRDQLGGLHARDGAVLVNLGVLTTDESVRLLCTLLGADRVRAEPDASAELAALCGQLPLALRIAAANLAAQPRRGIADYTKELATGDRLTALAVDGDPHTGVRAAFDHSYAALPAPAQRLFRLLGLISGPDITAAAAAALTGFDVTETERLLDQLAAVHLVARHSAGRFAMHDLVRLYAAVRADDPDRDDAVNRLLAYYLDTANAAASRLYPHVLRITSVTQGFDDHAEALAWLDAEHANLVTAVTTASGPVAWQLADTLRGYFFMRMHTVDWHTVATAGLAAATGDPRGQSAAHLSLATLARAIGDNRQAITHFTAALDLAEQIQWWDGCASALSNLGLVHWVTGQPESAIGNYKRALAIARKTGRLSSQASNLRRLGLTYWGLGQLHKSASHLSAALAVQQRLDSRSGEARTLGGLGEAQRALGQLDEAMSTLNQALALHREFGDRNREADHLRILAMVHRDAGRLDKAFDLASAAVALARATGSRPNEADALNTLGSVHDQLGRHRRAIECHGTALSLARDSENRYTETEALSGLAAAQHHAGNPGLAEDHAQAALTVARSAHYRLLEATTLTTLAAIRIGQRDRTGVTIAKEALALHTEASHALGVRQTKALLRSALSVSKK